MIKNIYQKNLTVYSLPDDFSVEIESDGEVTECYLCHKNYGVKSHMFGLLNKDINSKSLEEIICNNAPSYMETYMEEYGD